MDGIAGAQPSIESADSTPANVGVSQPSRASQIASKAGKIAMYVGIPGGTSVAAVAAYVAAGGVFTLSAPPIGIAAVGAAVGALALKAADSAKRKISERNAAPSETSVEQSVPKDPPTLIKELTQLLPTFSSQEFLSGGFRGRKESESIPHASRKAFIDGLKAVYNFTTWNTSNPPSNDLEEFLQQLAPLKEALYTRISQLPQQPTVAQKNFETDLRTVHDNFSGLVNSLNRVVYYQQSYNQDLIFEMFKAELELIGIFDRSQTDKLSEVFQRTLDKWKERLAIATSYEVMSVFFDEFKEQLNSSQTFEENPYSSLGLEKNEEFVKCLQEHICFWHKENVLTPRLALSVITCSEFVESLKKIELRLDELIKLPPLDALTEKTEYVNSKPLEPHLEEWEKLKTNCIALLLKLPNTNLEATLRSTDLAIQQLSLKLFQLLDLRLVLHDHMEAQYLNHSSEPYVSIGAKEAIQFICTLFLKTLEESKSSKFPEIWNEFTDSFGRYTDNPQRPFESTAITLFSWKTPEDLEDRERTLWRQPTTFSQPALQHFLTMEIEAGKVVAVLELNKQETKSLNIPLLELERSMQFRAWSEQHKQIRS